MNQRIRDVLEFYADRDNYYVDTIHGGYIVVMADKGSLARQALREYDERLAEIGRKVKRDQEILRANNGLCPVCCAGDGNEGCDGEHEDSEGNLNCPFREED